MLSLFFNFTQCRSSDRLIARVANARQRVKIAILDMWNNEYLKFQETMRINLFKFQMEMFMKNITGGKSGSMGKAKYKNITTGAH